MQEPPSYDFIQDFILFNSGNMAPRKYLRWCAISILAMTVARRVYIDYSYFHLYTDNYICLVGRQGLRKDTSMNEAFKIFKEANPEYPLGASVSSREKIVTRLCSDEDTLRTYTDETGTRNEFHPMAFFISELKNFMSVNPENMVAFLVDIYGKKFFDADTIKHGLQPINNPCVNILSCENPPWIINNLKANILSGGFARRMMFVYEIEEPVRITFPKIPAGGLEARDRCVQHLRDIQNVSGPFHWESPETMIRFDIWNKKLITPDDDLLRGFYENRDCLVLKLAMCITLARSPIELVLRWPAIEVAIAFIDNLAETLPRLTIAAGRNELAVPTQEMLDMLAAKGGMIPKKLWLREAIKKMNDYEFQGVFKSLRETDQIVCIRLSNGEDVICTPEKAKELIEKKQLVTQKVTK